MTDYYTLLAILYYCLHGFYCNVSFTFDYRQSLSQTPCSAEWTTHTHLCCLWAVMQKSLLWETLLTAFLLVHSQVSFLCLCWVCRAIVHLTAWHVGTGSSLPPRLRFGDPSCSETRESYTYTTSRKWNCTQSWGGSLWFVFGKTCEDAAAAAAKGCGGGEPLPHHLRLAARTAITNRIEAGGGLFSNRGDWVYATLDQRWMAGKSIYNTMQNRRSSTKPFFFVLCCCTCSMG